jgi:hypothetical protein
MNEDGELCLQSYYFFTNLFSSVTVASKLCKHCTFRTGPFTGIERFDYRLFGTRLNLAKMSSLEKDQSLQLLLGKKLSVFSCSRTITHSKA